MNCKHNLLLVWLLVIACFSAYADNYPKNPGIDILHYSFHLALSDENDEIAGTAYITLRFKMEGIQQLRLDLVKRPDNANAKGMSILSVLQEGKSLSYKHEGDSLYILLASPSPVNKEITIAVQYHGIPADGLRIGPTRHGSRSFFNENWPNRARHWLPVVDHPYEKATSEFIVKAPAHYQVISNGLLIEETDVGQGYRITHWKQSVPVSSWLYVLGVAEFAVQYVDSFEGKSIQTWVYPQDRDAGFYDFARPTKEVMAYFSDLVGRFAYEKLANVQSPSVQGGMETASAIYYGEDLINGKRDKRLRNVVIHELAHQWFGNAVTESSWDDAWLSEGFATYYTMLYIGHAYGSDEMVKELKDAKRRVYNHYAKNGEYPLVKDRSPEKEPVTSDITYQKGAWVLHMLRNKIGEAAYNEGIRAYYRRFFNANASTKDFIHEMEKVSGLELGPFFEQWLYHGSNIKLKGSWKYNKAHRSVKIRLEQIQPGGFLFDFPLELQLHIKGKTDQFHTQRINTVGTEFIIPVAGKPASITTDPRSVLLAEIDWVEKK